MIFNFPFLFLNLFNLISATTKRTASPPPVHSKSPTSPPIAQLDFLVTPDDFKHDEDVNYLLSQLHRPKYIEKFYRSAIQLYDDLAIAYQEIQADAIVADRFLNIMKRLTTASLKEPLTVTNLIFAASKHLRPLFKHKSQPIEEIYYTISNMEKDKSRKLIWLMTQFFLSFTLREVNQIQDFIRLVSLATLSSSDQPPATTKMTTKTRKSSASGAADGLKPVKKMNVVKKGELDISRTSLESYSERIRLTIANALSKMLILLDLFVTDTTVIPRSINLVNRLWSLHLHRLAQRENIPYEELDDKWKDPILYRKSAIHFTFDDWSPDTFSAEAMAELRKAVEEEYMDKADLNQQSSITLSRSFWIIMTIIFFFLATFTVAYFYLKRRLQRQQEQEKEIDLTSLDVDGQSINEIVSKLESNIE